MVVVSGTPQPEPWDTSARLGTSWTHVFEGEDGLRRLSGPTTYSAPAPEVFRARLSRLQLDGVSLEGISATEHASLRTCEHIRAFPVPMLTIASVQAGRVRVDLRDHGFEVGPGALFVLDSGEPVTLTVDSGLRALLTVICPERLPSYVLRRGVAMTMPVARTALVDAFTGFHLAALTAAVHGAPVRSGPLLRATVDLHAAVLTEALQGRSDPVPRSVLLRHRMEDYIDSHLADRDLSPETVASAVGISLRYAHAVFSDGGPTIARFIRDRRLEALAGELRLGAPRRSAAELAAQHGFLSAEAMGRAFRDRYGIGVAAYGAATRLGEDAQPV